MKRRAFLQTTATGALAIALPLPTVASASHTRTLILLELRGGNDGLNTLIPYADPLYAKARPNLAVGRDQVIRLDEHHGLHPKLEPLLPAWRSGEMAWIQGVGYPAPNRSHFRSIAIWETASDADQVLEEGWLGPLLPPATSGRIAEALVIGHGLGPLAASGRSVIVMQNPRQFLRQARSARAMPDATGNAALDHILRVQNDIVRAATVIAEKARRGTAPNAEFPRDYLGRQLNLAARLILSGVDLPVIKLSLGGFDTHTRQQPTHERLLGALAGGLAAFRGAMVDANLWDRVLVASYSEFGRRVAENGSRGTDHGTAAPHFLMGGRVRGGLYGQAPSLSDLDDGDLRFSTDFRRFYASLGEQWLDQAPGGLLAGYEALPLLRG